MNEKRAHCSSCTENILQFWQDRWTLAAKPCAFDMAKVEMFNSVAEYYELRLTATDGAALRARYICPVKGETVPTVLMFHDYGRGIRGWHHMTRYAALGFAVLALENRMLRFDVTSGWENGPEGLLAVTLFTDALTLARGPAPAEDGSQAARCVGRGVWRGPGHRRGSHGVLREVRGPQPHAGGFPGCVEGGRPRGGVRRHPGIFPGQGPAPQG